ncbi:MAG: hypothetical protein COA85_03935 [Robiginitomaculum sp.]|nr:MAG: hypothetical protein COA85_03935 [Robiginitomaculum sp.]
MSYYFSKTLDLPFDEAADHARAVIADHGFGVLTEIDVSATLKKKIGADLRPYLILGACNPKMAYQAIQAEDKIGLMLPCNIIVQQKEDGKVEISGVDPIASMQAVQNTALEETATKVRAMLKEIIEAM